MVTRCLRNSSRKDNGVVYFWNLFEVKNLIRDPAWFKRLVKNRSHHWHQPKTNNAFACPLIVSRADLATDSTKNLLLIWPLRCSSSTEEKTPHPTIPTQQRKKNKTLRTGSFFPTTNLSFNTWMLALLLTAAVVTALLLLLCTIIFLVFHLLYKLPQSKDASFFSNTYVVSHSNGLSLNTPIPLIMQYLHHSLSVWLSIISKAFRNLCCIFHSRTKFFPPIFFITCFYSLHANIQ